MNDAERAEKQKKNTLQQLTSDRGLENLHRHFPCQLASPASTTKSPAADLMTLPEVFGYPTSKWEVCTGAPQGKQRNRLLR